MISTSNVGCEDPGKEAGLGFEMEEENGPSNNMIRVQRMLWGSLGRRKNEQWRKATKF